MSRLPSESEVEGARAARALEEGMRVLQGEVHAAVSSKVALRNGSKILFAVAVELGWRRIPEVLYFSARTIEDVRAGLVRNALTFLPKGSKIVGVAPAVGFTHDEQGVDLRA